MQCAAAAGHIPLPVEVEDSGDVFNVSGDFDRMSAAVPSMAGPLLTRKMPSGRHVTV